jgi:hypothetical protein
MTGRPPNNDTVGQLMDEDPQEHHSKGVDTEVWPVVGFCLPRALVKLDQSERRILPDEANT